MSPLVNKLTKTFRWLRWSTVFAILFYMFFIGLILHSTTYKLQHTLKSRRQQQHESSIAAAGGGGGGGGGGASPAVATGNNVLHAPPETSLAATLQNMRRRGVNAVDAAAAAADVRGGRDSAAGDAGGKHLKTVQQQKRGHVAKLSAGPETVILAVSSVNEHQILEKAFRRADKNQDSQLTIQELAVYINARILDHIEEAIQYNPLEFRRVDIAPADGLVTWEEYHRFFLKEHGMSEADIDEHNEIKHTALNRKAREDMMRDKARWSEAARTDLFSLTLDEYLSFRHPESSVSNLLEFVDDLLRQFDQDGDEQLTIEEFSAIDDDDGDLVRKSLISKSVVERREEFKRIVDKNNDGKADRGELLNYVNPKTPRYALQEAATIFSLCDENKDGKLTLREMVTNAEIFLTSKMIDTANSFHTEF